MISEREWTSEQAGIRAQHLFEKDYGELNSEQRETVRRQVEKEWVEFYSGYCDHVYEVEKDRRIHESIGSTNETGD